MKIFCDADGTLINSIKKVCDLYNEDFRNHENFRYIHWTTIYTWEMKELTLTTKQQILDYFSDSRFFELTLEFLDNAVEVLKRLKDNHEIIICTIGTKTNLQNKEKFFKLFLPFAKFIGVDINEYDDKAHIDMSDGIFVDDLTKYLRTRNAKYKLTFSGNEYEFNTPAEYPVVSNWMDVERFIDGIITHN